MRLGLVAESERVVHAFPTLTLTFTAPSQRGTS